MGAAGMKTDAGQYLLFTAGGTDCAVDVAQVREVARYLPFTPVPAAGFGVAGVVNLRGHVLAALDIAALLQAESSAPQSMNIIAAHDGTFYSLLAESCGEVVSLLPENMEPLPPSARQWKFLAQYLCRHRNTLMPVIDIKYLIKNINAPA
jgi:purine-binding chemotaxis protein CheW